MGLAVALVAAVTGLAQAAADGLELKGIYPGMKREDVQAAHPNLECQAAAGVYACAYFTKHAAPFIESLNTLAGAPVTSWIMRLSGDDRVRAVLVVLETSSFDDVRGALAEKYGKPTTEQRSVVKNRMGAEFDQIETRWVKGDRVLRISKRGSKIDEMTVYLSSKEGAEDFEREKADRVKKGSKDL